MGTQPVQWLKVLSFFQMTDGQRQQSPVVQHIFQGYYLVTRQLAKKLGVFLSKPLELGSIGPAAYEVIFVAVIFITENKAWRKDRQFSRTRGDLLLYTRPREGMNRNRNSTLRLGGKPSFAGRSYANYMSTRMMSATM